MAGVSKKRKKHRSLMFVPVTVLLIIIIFVLGMSVFFRVSDITVVGNDKYTNSDIIKASKIETGNNMLFMKTEKIEKNVLEAYADIGTVSVQKKLPNKIIIVIGESESVASIEGDGSWWLIDENGKIIENTGSAGAAGKISITGVNAKEPKVGSMVKTEDEKAINLRYAVNILNALKSYDLQSNVTKLDVSVVTSVNFDYMGRFKVNCGNGEDAEYKISKLASVVTQLKDTDKGTIDISKEGETRFIPEV